jgi:hypothetical protein
MYIILESVCQRVDRKAVSHIIMNQQSIDVMGPLVGPLTEIAAVHTGQPLSEDSKNEYCQKEHRKMADRGARRYQQFSGYQLSHR